MAFVFQALAEQCFKRLPSNGERRIGALLRAPACPDPERSEGEDDLCGEMLLKSTLLALEKAEAGHARMGYRTAAILRIPFIALFGSCEWLSTAPTTRSSSRDAGIARGASSLPGRFLS